MRRKSFVFLIHFFISFSIAIPWVEACRFWVAVAPSVPQEYILDQLIYQPQSLKRLGETYADGWSIGYYDDGEELVVRGDEAAHFNEEYDEAVRFAAHFEPGIMMGHLRRASSGCVEGVPNPHPFRIKYNGIHWLFGHNGGMKKDILIDLIGKNYLKKYPPVVCTQNPPDSWIDSELYFIFIMKTIEEYDDRVEQGITAAVKKLYTVIDEPQRYLNFFLTNGEHVWVFRKGNSLFYKSDSALSVVTSTVPDPNDASWRVFPEDTLAVLSPREPMTFFSLIKRDSAVLP